MRFIDTNIFIYALTAHPLYGEVARRILERVEGGEQVVTSTLVLCEVSLVLEAMGRQSMIKPTLEQLLSYEYLQIQDFDADDLLVGANNMALHRLDFNDAVNVAIMGREGINEVYTNDQRHLGQIETLNVVFE